MKGKEDRLYAVQDEIKFSHTTLYYYGKYGLTFSSFSESMFLPQPTTSERQQESGTLLFREKVVLAQSLNMVVQIYLPNRKATVATDFS